MRRILIIDDDRLQGIPPSAVRATSSQDAINRLTERSVWDDVYFDHDLGGEDTSMAVVEWLEQRRQADNPVYIERVFVHSMNPVGADKLVQALARLYPTQRIPLPWKRESL